MNAKRFTLFVASSLVGLHSVPIVNPKKLSSSATSPRSSKSVAGTATAKTNRNPDCGSTCRANLLRGGDSGLAAVVPGNPDRSYLIEVINHVDEEMAMPPDDDKLPAEEIDD
jgi:hypothetical protein